MIRSGWLVPIVALLAYAGEGRAQVQIAGRAAEITVGGRLDVQFEHSSPDGGEPSRAFLRRARIQAEVQLRDLVVARLEPDFGENALKDAWIRFRFHPALRLVVGQFKRAHEPFDLESSTEFAVIEREGEIAGVDPCPGVGNVCTFGQLMSRLGYSGRDIGLGIDGTAGPAAFAFTLTNGSGPNKADENEAKSVSARVSVALTETFELSAFYGVHDHRVPGDSIDSGYAPAGGVDLLVGRYRDGFRFQAASAQGQNWRSAPEATFRTAQALASWYKPLDAAVLDGIESMLRVSWADPDTDTDGDHALLLTPGLMLHIHGRTRIGANLDMYDSAANGLAWSLKFQTYLFF